MKLKRKLRLIKVLLFFCLLWGTIFCRAGSLSMVLEPYLGYGPLSFTEAGESEQIMGAVLGGKGGFKFSNMYFALDYHTGGVYILNKFERSLAHQMFGAGIALFGSLWKVWVGYYPKNEWEDHTQFLEYSGMAYKVGVSWKFKSKLAINIEYLTSQITDKKQFGQDLVRDNIDLQQTLLSVSAPIKIF